MLPHSKNVGDPIHLPNPEKEGGKHHSGRGNSATKVVALVSTALILKHSSAISWAGGPLQRKTRTVSFLHQIYEHFKTTNLILDLSSFNSPRNMQSSSLCHFLHYSFSSARFQLNIVQFELSMVSRRPDCGSMMPYQRKFHAISPLISTIKKPKEKKTSFILTNSSMDCKKRPLPTDLVHDLCSQLLKKPDQSHFFPRRLSLSLASLCLFLYRLDRAAECSVVGTCAPMRRQSPTTSKTLRARKPCAFLLCWWWS